MDSPRNLVLTLCDYVNKFSVDFARLRLSNWQHFYSLPYRLITNVKNSKHKISRLAAGATRTAETVVPVHAPGIDPVPVRRAQEPGHEDESAAPQHTTIARRRAGGVGLRVRTIRAIPIRHPFPDIASHVIQAPRVGLLLAHRMSFVV